MEKKKLTDEENRKRSSLKMRAINEWRASLTKEERQDLFARMKIQRQEKIASNAERNRLLAVIESARKEAEAELHLRRQETSNYKAQRRLWSLQVKHQLVRRKAYRCNQERWIEYKLDMLDDREEWARLRKWMRERKFDKTTSLDREYLEQLLAEVTGATVAEGRFFSAAIEGVTTNELRHLRKVEIYGVGTLIPKIHKGKFTVTFEMNPKLIPKEDDFNPSYLDSLDKYKDYPLKNLI